MRAMYFLLVLAMYSCCEYNPKKSDLKKTRELPIRNSLQNKLDLIIDYKERLADSSSIYERPSSYWIFSYESRDTCYVVTMANFDFYNSAEMDGYFEYRNKYISVYDAEQSCAAGLFDTKGLKKGKIPQLIDYHFNEKDSIPPPIMAHEPYHMEYVVSSDSLILNFRGYR